jgi:hypothetical protein
MAALLAVSVVLVLLVLGVLAYLDRDRSLTPSSSPAPRDSEITALAAAINNTPGPPAS